MRVLLRIVFKVEKKEDGRKKKREETIYREANTRGEIIRV